MHEDQPCEVLESHVARKQQNKPVNKTKLRNLISGNVVEHTFHVSDKAEEADVGRKMVTYLFAQDKKNEAWFCASADKKDRFSIPLDVITQDLKYIKENTDVEALTYTNKEDERIIIGLKLPITVDLLVTEAPPSIKGNTASGGTKVVTLETGLTVNTPFHINIGDIVRVNTERGEYTERVEKA